jgi:hypothetical protein
VLNHPQPQFAQDFLGQLSVVATDVEIAVELIHEPTIELFVGSLIVTLGQRNYCPKFIRLRRHYKYLAANVAHQRNDIHSETIWSTRENERYTASEQPTLGRCIRYALRCTYS